MDDASLRSQMREYFWKNAVLETALDAASEDAQTFQMYDKYSEPVRTLPSHRILAINRGEKKSCLTVRVNIPKTRKISKRLLAVSSGSPLFLPQSCVPPLRTDINAFSSPRWNANCARVSPKRRRKRQSKSLVKT